MGRGRAGGVRLDGTSRTERVGRAGGTRRAGGIRRAAPGQRTRRDRPDRQARRVRRPDRQARRVRRPDRQARRVRRPDRRRGPDRDLLGAGRRPGFRASAERRFRVGAPAAATTPLPEEVLPSVPTDPERLRLRPPREPRRRRRFGCAPVRPAGPASSAPSPPPSVGPAGGDAPAPDTTSAGGLKSGRFEGSGTEIGGLAI